MFLHCRLVLLLICSFSVGCFPKVPIVELPKESANNQPDKTKSEASESLPGPEKESSSASETQEASKPAEISPTHIDAFIQAAAQGDVATVQRSLQLGMPINSVNADGNSALMIAAFEGHALVVDVLLKNGAKVDLANPLNRTALMFGSTGTSPDVVELLLKAGANVNAQDGHENWTPLMFAASEGHIDVIQKILNYKPKLDLVDTDGDSAYNFAAQKNHSAVLELLERHRKENP